MLVAEFTDVSANNWFEISLPVPIGTLNRLAALVVTDTFGQATLDPTNDLDTLRTDATSTPSWQMFILSGDDSRCDTILVPPVAGQVQDGQSLENVTFIRDDMAAMCWAVENTILGPLDNPRSGYEVQSNPPPAPTPLPSGIGVNYLLGTTSPPTGYPFALLSGGAAVKDPNFQDETPRTNMLRPLNEFLPSVPPDATELHRRQSLGRSSGARDRYRSGCGGRQPSWTPGRRFADGLVASPIAPVAVGPEHPSQAVQAPCGSVEHRAGCAFPQMSWARGVHKARLWLGEGDEVTSPWVTGSSG